MAKQAAGSFSHHENIIFLHLPKTAGTTLNFILDRQYESEIVYTIEGETLPALNAFESLDFEARKNIRVFKGHGEYGIHEYLNGSSKYFTFLRDPVDRAISDYYFILRSPDTPYHRYITEHNLSLKQAVESTDPLIMMPNGQTRHLAGVWRAGLAPCTEATLNQAKQNLRQHFIVGLTDKFDESICLLKSYFHWNNNVYYKKRNVTLGRPEREAIAPDALAAILRTNQYDFQLYHYAQAIFVEQMKQKGPFFPLRVRAYKSLNKAHEYRWFLRLLAVWHGMKNSLLPTNA